MGPTKQGELYIEKCVREWCGNPARFRVDFGLPDGYLDNPCHGCNSKQYGPPADAIFTVSSEKPASAIETIPKWAKLNQEQRDKYKGKPVWAIEGTDRSEDCDGKNMHFKDNFGELVKLPKLIDFLVNRIGADLQGIAFVTHLTVCYPLKEWNDANLLFNDYKVKIRFIYI